jgi:hypothetical protein
MREKIITLSVVVTLFCYMIVCYLFAGWRGFLTSLSSAILYGIIALIIKRDRDKQIESLSRHKAEIHNLRLAIEEFQRTVYLANQLMSKYGLSVKMPSVLPSVLPSVFDKQ